MMSAVTVSEIPANFQNTMLQLDSFTYTLLLPELEVIFSLLVDIFEIQADLKSSQNMEYSSTLFVDSGWGWVAKVGLF